MGSPLERTRWEQPPDWENIISAQQNHTDVLAYWSPSLDPLIAQLFLPFNVSGGRKVAHNKSNDASFSPQPNVFIWMTSLACLFGYLRLGVDKIVNELTSRPLVTRQPIAVRFVPRYV